MRRGILPAGVEAGFTHLFFDAAGLYEVLLEADEIPIEQVVRLMERANGDGLGAASFDEFGGDDCGFAAPRDIVFSGPRRLNHLIHRAVAFLDESPTEIAGEVKEDLGLPVSKEIAVDTLLREEGVLLWWHGDTKIGPTCRIGHIGPITLVQPEDYFFLAAFFAGVAAALAAARFSSMAAWAAARRATGTR